FYRNNQTLHINSGKNYVANPNRTPSPFLLNYIDVKNHGIISYEITRGCPFQCTYCQTATLPFRHFSVERICSDIQYFIEERVKQVRFIDSNVDLHPDFVSLFIEIKAINSKHGIKFSGFSYAEHLTEEKVSLLKECNFTFMEIGLQTIHQNTLKILHRTRLNRDAFISGLKLLEKYEITYHVDTIIGLPGESYHDYKATIDFLNDHTVDYIQAFPLMVMPGTRLNAMAESLGLKHQKTPPYYLIETDAIRREEIVDAKGKYHRVPTQPSNVNYTFLSKLNGSVFDINVSDQKDISSFTEIHGFNKLIIDMKGGDRGDKDYLKNVRNMLHENRMGRNINSPFTAWFKIQSPEQDFLLIKSCLDRIVSANPFILMNLIIEADQPFLPDQMDELTDSLHFQEFRMGLTRRKKRFLNHFLLLPWSVLQMQNKEMQEQLKNSNRVVWSVDISREIEWDEEINLIHQMVNDPKILFRFQNGCEKEIVFKVLRYLNRHKYEKSYFTNSALYYAMELLYMENTATSPASASVVQAPVPYEKTITYECGGQTWVQTVDQPIKHVKDVSFQVAFRKKFPHELTEPHDK
nr:radical SAM protein [Bacteroidota bacterium]